MGVNVQTWKQIRFFPSCAKEVRSLGGMDPSGGGGALPFDGDGDVHDLGLLGRKVREAEP